MTFPDPPISSKEFSASLRRTFPVWFEREGERVKSRHYWWLILFVGLALYVGLIERAVQ